MLEAATFIENVKSIAATRPERVFAKIISVQRDAREITYGVLLERAGRFASMYRERGVPPGEVIVIVHDDMEETIYGFIGAMLHGAIPSVFAHPSVKVSPAEYLKTLTMLLTVCETRFLLTYKALHTELSETVSLKNIESMLGEDALAFTSSDENVKRRRAQILLLQHSSGTTGLKKGVALSDENVVNQLRNYASTLRLSEKDKIASWLPLYHDMGLIACFILPLAAGLPVVMMSPFEWITNPLMLLRAIHEERCSLCWMPNFAYNFLASRVDEPALHGLDLSSMRAFINCAEPISADSHNIFYERFRAVGVRREMLCTCYAMAENTFAVTQGGVLEPVKIETIDGTALRNERQALLASSLCATPQVTISSGRLIPNNQVRIVEGAGNDLPERGLGEILIKSDSMLNEYYHRPDLAAQAIIDGWYRSGDLGYIAEGHLFVLGRLKDLIIVAGKNIYPQDIEEIVGGLEGVYPGRVVAFGVYNEKIGTEEVVILAETLKDKSKHLAIKLAIAKAVREQLECIANEIVLLPHMWLMKSSSGKISRPGNREKYLKELRPQ
jgi:fatty-acyl-CoA synthase